MVKQKTLTFFRVQFGRPLCWALCDSILIFRRAVFLAIFLINIPTVGHGLHGCSFFWPHWLTLAILPFAPLLGHGWEWCFQQVFSVSVSFGMFFFFSVLIVIIIHLFLLSVYLPTCIMLTTASFSSTSQNSFSIFFISFMSSVCLSYWFVV